MLKQRIYHLISKGKDDDGDYWSEAFDIFIIVLILASVVEVIAESFQGMRETYFGAFSLFEYFTVTVFTVEYLLRVWTADLKYPELTPWRARLRWMTSWMGVVDLLAILPFYLPLLFAFDLRFVRILRVFRLLRVFKLSRYTHGLTLVGAVFYERREELGISLLVATVLLLLSATVMYNLENEAQPEQFPNIIATFWWAVATLTTVGYGDVYPVTGLGRLVGGVIAVLGIGLVALPAGIISAGFIEKIEERDAAEAAAEAVAAGEGKGWKFCPHCGERLTSQS